MHEEQHICHYDVKPANILLDDNGNAILIDFGISKNYDAQGQETTTTPIGMSEGYAPIEQYQQNVEEFSPVSDVYALGATLYYLLHGKRPVSAVHRASGTALLMSKHLSQGIKDIINASMKISKRERAKSVDVFMGSINTSAYRGHTIVQDDESTILESAQRARKRNTTYTHPDTTSSATNTSNTERNSNSSIGWIIGIALACIVGFFLFQRETTIGKVDNGDNSSEQLPTENIKNEETSNQESASDNIYKQEEKDDEFAFDPWSGKLIIDGGIYRGPDTESVITIEKNGRNEYSGEINLFLGYKDDLGRFHQDQGAFHGRIRGKATDNQLTIILDNMQIDNDSGGYIEYYHLEPPMQIFRITYNKTGYSVEPVGKMGGLYEGMTENTCTKI